MDALPAAPGKTAVELFEAAARGEIKALWIACTNPAQSMPDQALVRRALARCELVILQEAFADTATAAHADVLLPAASWGEKEGTVTNSERRISRVRAAIAPPGAARPDWQIVCDLARSLEALVRPGRPSLFDQPGPEALWMEHREATRGRDLDISGLSYALLERAGPQQWPFPEGAATGRARLYGDACFATPDGGARFIAKAYAAPAERVDARHPIALSTGRLRDQWHGMSRSGLLPQLFGHEATPALRMHPQDMARRGLVEGGLVRVSSARGTLALALRGDAGVAPAQAHLAMHWGEEFMSGCDAQGHALLGVNALTQPLCCADSRQPELKFAAVAVESLELPWRLSAAGWCVPDDLATTGRRLRALLAEFDYAHCVPVAGPADGLARVGWSFEGASAAPPAAALVARLAAILGLEGMGVLRYADTQRGRTRLLRLDGQGESARLASLLRVGMAGEGDWLDALWRRAELVAPHGRRLLAPDQLAAAGQDLTPPSAQVCNCFDLSEARIRSELSNVQGAPAERLKALQTALRCGTQCGSCLPALRRLVQQVSPAQQAVTP